MVDSKNYTRPIIYISIVVAVLLFLMSIGFVIGFLSENPDGLERSLIDANGESWIESLPSPWTPILGWINNDYIAGLVGVGLSVALIISVFYLRINLAPLFIVPYCFTKSIMW